jgi:histone deacetylase complex regulatory component SIN3
MRHLDSMQYGGPFPKVFDFNSPSSNFKTAIDTTDDVQMKNLSKNELQFFEQMREVFDNEEVYVDIMKLFNLYVEGVIGADELFVMSEATFATIDDDFQFFSMFQNITLSRETN